jgi:hypothetical protein
LVCIGTCSVTSALVSAFTMYVWWCDIVCMMMWHSMYDDVTYIGTCSVTSALVSAFTKKWQVFCLYTFEDAHGTVFFFCRWTAHFQALRNQEQEKLKKKKTQGQGRGQTWD